MQPQTLASPAEALEFIELSRNDPGFFFEQALGIKPWPYQLAIAESVRDHRITTVRSCHEIGKSFMAARITIWYLMTHPESIVVTTAPTARQVENILWREVNTAYNKARIPLSGKCITTLLEFDKNWYGVGYSTNEPDKFQGMHSDSGDLLVITDEAAGIPEVIFEGVRAVMTSSKCRLLMIGNPTSSAGTFYNSHSPKSTANKMAVSMFDTPNFKVNNIRNEDDLIQAIESKRELIEPAPYLASIIWGYECLMEWGPDSPMYQARCLGVFPDQGDETLIPLSWILASMTPEHHALMKRGEKYYGVDVARFGNDRTVILKRDGQIVDDIAVHSMQSTMETSGRVMNILTNDPTARAYVDVIGLGAGVVDRLHELQREKIKEGEWQWTKVFAVNVAEKADAGMTERERDYAKKVNAPKLAFRNKRAELYWRLRGMFERGELALPDTKLGHDLAAELSMIQYKFESDGSIYIEEKKDIKKRLLMSPDLADALMLSFAANPVGEFILPEVQTPNSDSENDGPRPTPPTHTDQFNVDNSSSDLPLTTMPGLGSKRF